VEPDRSPRRFGPRQVALEHHRRLRFSERGLLGARLGHHNDRGGLGGRRGSHTLSQPARNARTCWLFVRGLRDSAPADDLEPRPPGRPGGCFLLCSRAHDGPKAQNPLS
jgi:hypothetical protein